MASGVRTRWSSWLKVLDYNSNLSQVVNKAGLLSGVASSGEELQMRIPVVPAEYHRDAAERFRLLADIEIFPDLRRQFRRRAAQHEQWAVDLHENPPMDALV
jgi:hypothetical protein